MDASTGFKTATSQEPTQATAVMDPSHVLYLAGEALDRCPHRVQQQLHGHRDLSSDPLYRARRLLPTGTDLPTDRRATRTMSRWSGPPLNGVRPSHNPIQTRS